MWLMERHQHWLRVALPRMLGLALHQLVGYLSCAPPPCCVHGDFPLSAFTAERSVQRLTGCFLEFLKNFETRMNTGLAGRSLFIILGAGY